MIAQRLTEKRTHYLRDAGITALLLFELKAVLSVYGWKIRREASASERTVTVHLWPDAAPVQRAAFWLKRAAPNAPVMIEDDEEDEPQAPQPLPPAVEGGR